MTITGMEDGAEEITFTLLDDLNFGTLMFGGTELGEGDTFTQGDIDDGLLSYTQDGDAMDNLRFTASDTQDVRDNNDGSSSGYQVSDDGAGTFNITIDTIRHGIGREGPRYRYLMTVITPHPARQGRGLMYLEGRSPARWHQAAVFSGRSRKWAHVSAPFRLSI
jgi:hypothetical protein